MRGCTELCGFTPAEVSAMEGRWLAVVHPEDRQRVAAEVMTILEKPLSIVQVYRIRTKSGEERWVEDRKNSFFENGQFAGVDGILFDVTGRRQAEAALKQAQEDLIAEQSRAIHDLSTPVLQVWKDILVLPLIGTVDTQRAQQIVEALLESIVQTRAQYAIIDITGVPVVDSSVANHALRAIAAARLVGAEVIMTGMSPVNAMTLVKMGVDVSGVMTMSSLRAGLELAIAKTGYKVVKTDQASRPARAPA
jgi:rsbT co-antagonist protein RsbR